MLSLPEAQNNSKTTCPEFGVTYRNRIAYIQVRQALRYIICGGIDTVNARIISARKNIQQTNKTVPNSIMLDYDTLISVLCKFDDLSKAHHEELVQFLLALREDDDMAEATLKVCTMTVNYLEKGKQLMRAFSALLDQVHKDWDNIANNKKLMNLEPSTPYLTGRYPLHRQMRTELWIRKFAPKSDDQSHMAAIEKHQSFWRKLTNLTTWLDKKPWG